MSAPALTSPRSQAHNFADATMQAVQQQLLGPPPRTTTSTAGRTHMTISPSPNQPNGGYVMWNGHRQPTCSSPSSTQMQHRERRKYDPMAYSQYMDLPPLPAADQLIRSTTYIPEGESSGPGVGIRPLQLIQRSQPQLPSRPGTQSLYSYNRGASGDLAPSNKMVTQTLQGQGGGGTNNDPHGQNHYQDQTQGHYQTLLSNNQPQHYQRPTSQAQSVQGPQQPQKQNNYPLPTLMVGRQKAIVAPAKETQEHPSPDVQPQNPYPLIGAAPSRAEYTEEAPPQGNGEHSSSGDTLANPQEQRWPLEHVQIWLATHSFSKEWQAAFQHLNIYGDTFLDIGRAAAGGQRNFSFIPRKVLPLVARECTAGARMWDELKEREESRRIRRLVKGVLISGGADTPATAASSSDASLQSHYRRQSSQLQHLQSTSAGTDGGVENLTHLSLVGSEWSAFTSSPDTAGKGDSPGRSSPPIFPAMALAQRRLSGQQRAASLDPLSRSLDEKRRSGFPSAALGALHDVQRRHSPSSNRDFAPGSGHECQCPQQSPRIASARPAPAADHRYYAQGHFRNASTEMSTPYGSNMSPASGRLSACVTTKIDSGFAKSPPEDSTKRRNATKSFKPPPAESYSSQETPASAKEHKSFLAKSRRDEKNTDVGFLRKLLKVFTESSRLFAF